MFFKAPYIGTKFFAHIYSPGTSEARQRVVDRGFGEDNKVDNDAFTRPFGRVKSAIVDLIVLSNSMVEHKLESRRYGGIQAVIPLC